MSVVMISSRSGYEAALDNQARFTEAQREMAIGSPHLAFFIIRARSMGKARRRRIFLRDGGVCHHCKAPLDFQNFHVDHFVALRNGGSNEDDNLVASCAPCNLSKGAKWA